MVKRIYHKKKSASGKVKVVVWCAVIFGIVWFSYKIFDDIGVFHPEKLVENSILKAEGFSVPVEEISSREGITAYYFEDHTNPIISVSFLFKHAGTAYDPQGESGISNMLAALLTEGTEKYDRKKFKELSEDNAITISFSTDKDDFRGSLLTLKEDQRLAFDMLRSVLVEPSFNRSDIKRVKEQMLQVLKRQQEYPESRLALVWAEDLYQGHPYARNPAGKKSDIEALNRDKLQAFMQKKIVKNNLIVGIAGDISRQDAEKMLDKVFGGLPEGGKQAEIASARVFFDGHEKNVPDSIPQVVALFSAQGVSRNHPDFYPLYIANQIFGGSGLNSRVSKAAREDKGLTYGVGSYLVINDKSDLIKGGFSTTPDKYRELKKLVEKEWENMAQGVSEAEFEQAKNYMTASYNLRFASLADISAILTAMQRENLGRDFLQKRNEYVSAVTLDDVNEVSARYFVQDKLNWASIGDVCDKKGE